MRKLLIILALCCTVGNTAAIFGQTSDDEANRDVLIRAMRAELARSVDKLKLDDLEKPYFIEFALDDAEIYAANATFGAITGAGRTRLRVFNPLVRVGSYDSDNSGYLSFSTGFRAGSGAQTLVLDDDELALRRDIWLATDTTYKQAAEQFAAKVTFLKNKVIPDKQPDFVKVPPMVELLPRMSLEVDEARWTKAVREWSALFRQYPEIQDSGVTFEARAGNSYVVNSEGTLLRRPFMLYSVTVQAQAQAADGLTLNHTRSFNWQSSKELPSNDDVAKLVKQVAVETTALRNAPLFDDKYLGPVLLTGEATGEFFSQMLAPNLSGDRPPLLEDGFIVGSGRLEFADRLNRRVMPKFITVYDDPTAKKDNDVALFGTYHIDDQGVKGEKVPLIENGILRSLLTSRRPRKEMPQLNGHARAASLGAPQSRISNLFVRAKDGKSNDDLTKDFLKACRELELPFCIKITLLTVDPSPTGASLSSPALAYKVYPDGREELVRGVQMGEVTLRVLRDITAAGSDNFTYNTTLSGDYWRGGLPVSISAPPVVIEEMEMKKISGTQQKPALLTHPFFSAKEKGAPPVAGGKN